jgi:transposase
MTQSSWFTVQVQAPAQPLDPQNFKKIFWPLPPSLSQGITGSVQEATEREERRLSEVQQMRKAERERKVVLEEEAKQAARMALDPDPAREEERLKALQEQKARERKAKNLANAAFKAKMRAEGKEGSRGPKRKGDAKPEGEPALKTQKTKRGGRKTTKKQTKKTEIPKAIESGEEKKEEDQGPEEEKKNKTLTVCHRVKLEPSKLSDLGPDLKPLPSQLDTLRRWFGTARWTYNQCVQDDKTALEQGLKHLDQSTFRSRHVTLANFEPGGMHEDKPWVLETPYEIRSSAILDYMWARKGCKVRKDKGGIKKYDFKFRCRKQTSQSISILAKKVAISTSPEGVLVRRIRKCQKFPQDLSRDMRLVCKRGNEYFLHVPQPMNPKSESQAPEFVAEGCAPQYAVDLRPTEPTDMDLDPTEVKMVEDKWYYRQTVAAIDPGVRTFGTVYTDSGHVYEWGKQDVQRIYRLCKYLDDLLFRMWEPGVRHRQRYQMRKAASRMRKRLRNLVDDFHRVFAKWLCETFQLILLPKFQVSNMVNKKTGRKINSTTARQMLSWGHFRFRERLQCKAHQYPWCKVVIVDEAYTTQTCGKCGILNKAVEGNKTFKCPACGFTWDRDLNGARNILLKYAGLAYNWCMSASCSEASERSLVLNPSKEWMLSPGRLDDQQGRKGL